jgi:glucosamine--fructose-6-phosphate aminotransferase (isomerizing)
MFNEAKEAGEVVRRQRERNAEVIAALAARLRADRPRAVVTLARGSSDHAATFARYLIETKAGVLTSSASPSVTSIYDSTPDFSGTILLVISQSGKSPDLINAAERAADKGATVVALVNDENSPLAALAHTLIPLCAGPERSVAATKSFIAALAATLDLLAAWTKDSAVDAALSEFPDALEEGWELDWHSAVPVLRTVESMYVAGRGHGLGIAQEAALKLKETCAIHAEAFSAAEIRHGPMATIGPGVPVLLFGQPDESLESVQSLAKEFAASGARVISVGVPDAPGICLPMIDADPLTTPILEIASFYRLSNSLALSRGRDPDRPPHLRKVTETL